MKKPSLTRINWIISCMVLAACGDRGPTTSLKVSMTEFVFTPSTFTIPAGVEITLTAANNGSVEHEFVIMNFGTSVGEDFGPEDEENIYWEIEVDAGESKTVTFTAPPDPGTYQVVCGTTGHFIAGMTADLIVVGQ